ncbi:hypothetical protein VTK73DRAFT_6681 [Phialemonium thermophilum]|uniref:NLE domain-containing protein n=1 Tax=Phialemonium thermophilum TaxID=223376 RepID=A0ABR3WIQ5_9PEZI
MATVVPLPSKRQRREDLERTQVQQDVTVIPPQEAGSFKARFVDSDGHQMTDVVEIPLADATERNISLLLNTLLQRDRDDHIPYRFRIQIPTPPYIIDTYPSPAEFLSVLRSHGIVNPFETTITLSAEPQSVFKVQAVNRLTHRIPGHKQPILTVQFSPASSSRLATGSGDCTACIWDTETGTPKFTLKGHTGWVLGVNWSPDGERLATCSMDKTVRIWDPTTGKGIGDAFRGHVKPILMMAWEPYHLWRDGTARLASASSDATVRVWIVNTGRTEHVLSGHKGGVTCVRWGGGGKERTGLIFSASRDKTVRVWDAVKGTLVHSFASHAHQVNHLALSTDFVLQTGFFEVRKEVPATDEEKRAKAKERFEKMAVQQGKLVERLVSASEDCTMYLWDPLEGTQPLARMLGHQKAVNHVVFSPDGTLIASCGWDNHVKIWSARDGRFIKTLLGHVGPVYLAAFSADSRQLVSASKDTTLKTWNMRTLKLATDLPGHEDEVYAVHWSPDGLRIGSGGKDKAVRLWMN